MLALVGMTGLVGLALLTVADVLSRWLFHAPLRATENVIDVVIPIVVACSLPSGLVHGHDVAIRFLGALLGRIAEDWLELFAMLTTLIFYILLTWQIGVYAKELGAAGRVTEIIRLPMSPFWWATTGLLACGIVVQVAVIAARVQAFGTGRFSHVKTDNLAGNIVDSEPDPSRGKR